MIFFFIYRLLNIRLNKFCIDFYSFNMSLDQIYIIYCLLYEFRKVSSVEELASNSLYGNDIFKCPDMPMMI